MLIRVRQYQHQDIRIPCFYQNIKINKLCTVRIISKFKTVALAFIQTCWSAPVGGDVYTLHVKSGGAWNATWLSAGWSGKPTTATPRGTNQHGWPETNDRAALFRMVTTAGAWLWECPVNPTHHRVQPVALLILSDVLLVPQGGSHRGSAEESKQAVTSWSTEPVRGCFPFPINPLFFTAFGWWC